MSALDYIGVREFVPYMGNTNIMALPFKATEDSWLAVLNDEVREAVAKRNELDRLASGHGAYLGG